MNILKKIISSFTPNYGKLISKLLDDEKIYLCDIGARGGINKVFQKVPTTNIVKILLEAEATEARSLKASNTNDYIINGLISNTNEMTNFYHTLNPSYSSLLKPNHEVLKGYLHYEKNFYKIEKIEKLPSKSLSSVINELGLDNLDIMKIDVQGAENIIFEGINDIHWEQINCIITEAYPIQYYENSSTIVTILEKMYEQNFELFDLKIIHNQSVVKSMNKEIFNHNYLSARPGTIGFEGRNMVYDLLLFKNKSKILQQDKSKIIKSIATFCLFNFFDHAIDLLIRSYDKNVLSDGEYYRILNSIQLLHYKALKPINRFTEIFKLASYTLPKIS